MRTFGQWHDQQVLQELSSQFAQPPFGLLALKLQYLALVGCGVGASCFWLT